VSDEFLGRLERLEAEMRSLRDRLSGSPKKDGKFSHSRPANYEELAAYIMGTLKLSANDAASLWEHWEGNGFTNRGKTMASWRATASNWERRRIFFPSLKGNTK
jgi:hypothetical protein